jgi:hypothetical protein
MRTLHVDSGREMRGGQWQVVRLLEALPSEGVAAALLCRAGSPLFAEALRRGIDAHPLGALALARAARTADLVHAHDARSHTLSALLAPARPLVVSRRVAFPIGSAWKYRRAAHYAAVSKCVAGVLAAGGVPPERISVVYDAAPLAAPAPEGPRAGILAPDTSDPMKGRDLVLRAAALAGVEIRFSRRLEADLPGAALFLYITRLEGLGSAVLLAMAAGTPVIASNVGGLAEVVEDGVNGLLTDNSPEAIASAITRLSADPTTARALAARARGTVEERFTVQRMVRGTIDVYRKVLACRNPR